MIAFIVPILALLSLVFYVMYLKSKIETLKDKLEFSEHMLKCERDLYNDLKQENFELIDVLWSNAEFFKNRVSCSEDVQTCTSSIESSTCA